MSRYYYYIDVIERCTRCLKDRCSAVNTFTQEAKLNLVTADLNGLRADLVNKILLSCLDESLKDKTADRQKLIKVTKLFLVLCPSYFFFFNEKFI